MSVERKGALFDRLVDAGREKGYLTFSELDELLPAEMRRMIEKVSVRPGINKIELFARKKVLGWDVWGDEMSLESQFYV